MSCLVPLIEAGFIDWIVSTGANLYHDTHFALGMDLHQSRPGLDDLELRENQVIRIYDIVFDYENLLGTDRFYRTLCRGEPFQKTMGTAEFHYLVGKYLAAREDEVGPARARSLLAAAYRCGVPIFTSSPGDSSIGMNLAALQLEGSPLRIDPLRDVNQTAAIVYDAKKNGPQRRASSWAAARPRTSSCRPSRRFRRCSAWRRAATITSCRSPTPAPTPAA